MGNLGPVYLAWSHLRHRGAALFGPLLVVLVCHMLLFTLAGALSMESPPRPGALPSSLQATADLVDAIIPDQSRMGAQPSSGRAAADNPSAGRGVEQGEAREWMVRSVGTGVALLVVLLLFWSIAAAETEAQFIDFTVLRAVGYPLAYLHAVVLAEMILLVLMALAPAMVLAPGVDAFVRAWSGRPLTLSLGRVGAVLLAAMLLGTTAALLATRRIRTLDPAELF
jgi:hypothetical protein